jgi:hypothetical protein
LNEAENQVRQYAPKLQARHGEALRLRLYVVAAVGFERLVWREVG